MKNIVKIALTLFASISLLGSANAGELTVTGSAKATYSIVTGGTSDGAYTGKALGISNEMAFGAKGELDNGWTWAYNLDLDTAAAGGVTENDDSSLTLSTPYGTVGIFISEGGLAVDDSASASVYGRQTDLTIADGIVEGISIDSHNNIQYHTPAGLLPFGTTFKAAYSPSSTQDDGMDVKSPAGTWDIYGNRAHAYQLTTSPIEGLTIYADYYNETEAGTTTTPVVQELESGSLAASYTTGPVKVGISRTIRTPLIIASSATATTPSTTFMVAASGNDVLARQYTTNKYSVAFNATENLSLSYEYEKSNRELIVNAAESDIKASAIQAAYTMGGMTFAVSHGKVDNASYTANNDSQETLFAVAMAF
jgi:hypothetical protein